MKPIHNLIFCIGCLRQKMLFESKSKADNFLRYNSAQILEENKKAPIRSYYCEFCCGYQVTSNPSHFDGERLDLRDNALMEKMITLNREQKSKKPAAKAKVNIEVKRLHTSINERALRINALVTIGRISEAEDLLDICVLEIQEIASFDDKANTELLTKLNGKVEKLKTMIMPVKKMLALSGDEQLEFVSNFNDKEKSKLKLILFNVLTIRMIDDMMSDNEIALQQNHPEKVAATIKKCREELNNIKGDGKNIICPEYKALLDEQESLLQRITPSPTDKPAANADDNPIDQDHGIGPYNIKEKTYRKRLLDLLDMLEQIRADYEKADYEACKAAVERGYSMLDRLGVTNEDTTLIEQHFDQWSDMLGLF